MSKPTFVYVTYIAATPEQVFAALTDFKATESYWFRNAVTSDWKVGSPLTFERDGELIISGEVLEYAPPHRLSYTFHPEHDGLGGEKASRVVFEIEPQPNQVKLTVIHDDFAPDTKVFERISGGWPLVLSSLKSYLESGRVLWSPWCGSEEPQRVARSA